MSNDDNLYSITDLDGYASHIREAVAKSFQEDYTENLDDYISLEQIKQIIDGYSLGTDENNDYLINEEVFNDIFDDIREFFYGVGVAKLAAKDLIECAWDNNLNEMVFWVKDNDTEQKLSNHGSEIRD